MAVPVTGKVLLDTNVFIDTEGDKECTARLIVCEAHLVGGRNNIVPPVDVILQIVYDNTRRPFRGVRGELLQITKESPMIGAIASSVYFAKSA